MNFQAFINDIESNNWNVYGIEVYLNGELVHSYGDTVKNKYPIYSATKTILSIAVGIACDAGIFDIDKSICDYLSEDILEQLSQKQLEIFRKITIERLLTMSVNGFPFRPEGDNYLDFALNCKIADVDKREFHYSNISAYLVGVALSNAIGGDLYPYLNEKIFIPLHIKEPVYAYTPEGYFYGASGMKMTVHDLSQVGLMLYHDGIYEGKQIVSENYVKRATSVRQENREGGYGYFIWKYRNGFSINGKWKQKCYVLPEEGIIVTFLSHIEDEECRLKQGMEKHILGL